VHSTTQRVGVDERTLADTPVLDPARTVRTDVERVLWADAIRPDVLVSGHVYDVETGVVTTIVDARRNKYAARDRRLSCLSRRNGISLRAAQ
jgi:carbonic anhydrase